MRFTTALAAVAALGFTLSGLSLPRDDPFTRQFALEPHELAATGRNPYFVLEPGYQLELANGPERLVITVLAETKVEHRVLPPGDRSQWIEQVRDVVLKRPELARLFR